MSPRPFARATAMKSASITSSIPTLRLRTRIGAIANEAVSPGSTRASRWPPKPATGPAHGHEVQVYREDLNEHNAEPEGGQGQPDDRNGRGRRGRPTRSGATRPGRTGVR